MTKVHFSTALIGLSLALSVGSAVLSSDEALGETSSALQMSSWAPGSDNEAYLGGQLASLHGTTYMVRSDRCGAWSCSGDAKSLFWLKLTPTGWSDPTPIGQRTSHKVSLAAFNGFLYLVRTGETDESTVWISKFDPGTEQWTDDHQLHYTTFAGPPALAAFDGKLHLVGTDEDCQMWAAEMTVDERFSTAKLIAAHSSCSRPSVAVFDGKLYAVHRAGATGEISFTYRSAGDDTSWSTDRYILDGRDGRRLRSLEPVIATAAGQLHLVFRTPESDRMWWTYFDGCAWARARALASWQTTTGPSLTEGRVGLVLATTWDVTWNEIVETRGISTRELHVPPAPLDRPRCGIAS